MKTENVNEELVDLLCRHGIQANIVKDTIQVSSRPDVLVDSRICYKKEREYCISQLDIEFSINNRHIIECFGDWGQSRQIAKAANLDNFRHNSFYPLIACLFDFPASDMVVETWEISDRAYLVYWGNYAVKTVEGGVVHDLPPALPPKLEGFISGLELNKSYHWIRWYVGFDNGELTGTEFLLDNVPNQDGKEMLNSVKWPPTEGYYSVRNFMLFKRI